MGQIRLSEIETRVVSVLVEKEMTTPEYYPLSLNALLNACNQKTNRDPVTVLGEAEVAAALERLRHLGLVTRGGAGGRVGKYAHNLSGKLHLEPETLAVLTEMMLRGPQTVGELRNRAGRMQPLPDLAAVEMELEELMNREPPLVVRMPRQPGRKEHRYMHLLCGLPEKEETIGEPPPEEALNKVRQEKERILRLEDEVASLRNELDALRQELTTFKAEFE